MNRWAKEYNVVVGVIVVSKPKKINSSRLLTIQIKLNNDAELLWALNPPLLDWAKIGDEKIYE